MIYSINCKGCANYFQKSWKRCKHCGSKRSLNYQIIFIGILVIITIILGLLIIKE